MQDAITQSERDALQSSGDLPPVSREPGAQQDLEAKEQAQPDEMLKSNPLVGGTSSPSQRSGPRVQRHAFLPPGGWRAAALAGVMAGVLAALVITLVNTGPSTRPASKLRGITSRSRRHSPWRHGNSSCSR